MGRHSFVVELRKVVLQATALEKQWSRKGGVGRVLGLSCHFTQSAGHGAGSVPAAQHLHTFTTSEAAAPKQQLLPCQRGLSDAVNAAHLVARLHPSNQLHQPHDWHRIHEVHPNLQLQGVQGEKTLQTTSDEPNGRSCVYSVHHTKQSKQE